FGSSICYPLSDSSLVDQRLQSTEIFGPHAASDAPSAFSSTLFGVKRFELGSSSGSSSGVKIRRCRMGLFSYSIFDDPSTVQQEGQASSPVVQAGECRRPNTPQRAPDRTVNGH
ncbi:MAG: hypothetical protein ACRDHX_01475, partial [Chloroflexota bacterium]